MILIVDDLAIFREPIAACLRIAGHQTMCACDGKEGLAMVRTHRPELVLLDMAMPAMDGLAFLRALRSDPAIADIPVIMLTAISDKARVIEAIRLGAREYLLKSRFSSKDLLEKVNKHLPKTPGGDAASVPPSSPPASVAASPSPGANQPPAAPRPAAKAIVVPKLFERDECLKRAHDAVQAKTLSGVVAQVINLASSSWTDAKELASFIARDPMLSARVLMTANSAAYSSSNKGMVTSIPQAVKTIGFSVIRNIAVTVGVFDVMPKDGVDGFNPIRCWQHSFAVAQLCEQIELLNNPATAPIAYIVGLCHELGEMLIRTHFAKECQQLMELQAETGQPIEDLEKKMLGVTRRQVKSSFLESLGLPESIRKPIDAYHRGLDNPATDDRLAQVLRLGDIYANGLLMASTPNDSISSFQKFELRTLTGTDEPARPDAESFRASITSLTVMLAKLGAAEEAQLMAPLFPRTSGRIWMVRDRLLSTFDPIKSALECLGKVTLNETLPLISDAGKYDALVVVATKRSIKGMTAADLKPWLSPQNNATPPLLWMVTFPDPATGNDTVKPQPGSIALKQLAHFIDSVKSPAPALPTKKLTAA